MLQTYFFVQFSFIEYQKHIFSAWTLHQ